MTMEIYGYLAMMLVGIVLGSAGAGGSMFSIPVLLYLFSMNMETASAYSLFLVGVTSLAGIALKQKQRNVSLGLGMWLGVPSVIGAFIARSYVIGIVPEIISIHEGYHVTKEVLLKALFSLLLIASSVTLLHARRDYQQENKMRTHHLIPIGLFTGLAAGLAGAGGGFLIVPSLIVFARLTVAQATATSLLVIASNSLTGFCGDLLTRSIHWPHLLSLTAMAIIGLLLGNWSQNKLQMRFASQRGVAWTGMFVGISILIKAWWE
jgi:uncharacterized membrane protein YfcA